MRCIDADKLTIDMTENVFCGDRAYKIFGYSKNQIDSSPTVDLSSNPPLTLKELRELSKAGRYSGGSRFENGKCIQCYYYSAAEIPPVYLKQNICVDMAPSYLKKIHQKYGGLDGTAQIRWMQMNTIRLGSLTIGIREHRRKSMNLTMNLHDLELWEQGRMKAFAAPANMMEKNIRTVGIKEPFRRITTWTALEEGDAAKEKKILVGVRYRFDEQIYLLETALNISSFEEASRWSPASQLPVFAIRRHANVVSISAAKPLQSFTEEEIKLMCLDYASQGDPQLLLKGYMSSKNYELLFDWWKQHYKSTLKNSTNPMAVLLHLHAGNKPLKKSNKIVDYHLTF